MNPEEQARQQIDRLLTAAEVIAQEIVEDLEAALEQFRLIAGDLGGTAESVE